MASKPIETLETEEIIELFIESVQRYHEHLNAPGRPHRNTTKSRNDLYKVIGELHRRPHGELMKVSNLLDDPREAVRLWAARQLLQLAPELALPAYASLVNSENMSIKIDSKFGVERAQELIKQKET